MGLERHDRPLRIMQLLGLKQQKNTSILGAETIH